MYSLRNQKGVKLIIKHFIYNFDKIITPCEPCIVFNIRSVTVEYMYDVVLTIFTIKGLSLSIGCIEKQTCIFQDCLTFRILFQLIPNRKEPFVRFHRTLLDHRNHPAIKNLKDIILTIEIVGKCDDELLHQREGSAVFLTHSSVLNNKVFN